jgi:hypothetical protein
MLATYVVSVARVGRTGKVYLDRLGNIILSSGQKRDGISYVAIHLLDVSSSRISVSFAFKGSNPHSK